MKECQTMAIFSLDLAPYANMIRDDNECEKCHKLHDAVIIKGSAVAGLSLSVSSYGNNLCELYLDIKIHKKSQKEFMKNVEVLSPR